MIHDAKITVTCDGIGCSKSQVYAIPFTYTSFKQGVYVANDSEIEAWITKAMKWIAKDGKHFCDQNCCDGFFNKRDRKVKAANHRFFKRTGREKKTTPDEQTRGYMELILGKKIGKKK